MKNLTEIVFILDCSGSMAGLEGDTIGGFNSLIAKQKKEDGQALVSTVLFNDKITVLHDRISLENIGPMTESDYFVHGCTALLDAAGGTINHIKTIHKYLPEKELPHKTIFIITTDGLENSSRYYTYTKLKDMIEKQKAEYGWQFIFLGANIDAIDVANKFGIEKDYAANYHCDKQGTVLNYEVLDCAISQIRSKKGNLSADWKSKIDDDFKRRKK